MDPFLDLLVNPSPDLLVFLGGKATLYSVLVGLGFFLREDAATSKSFLWSWSMEKEKDLLLGAVLASYIAKGVHITRIVLSEQMIMLLSLHTT